MQKTKIVKDKSLRNLNTFRLDVVASEFAVIKSEAELKQILSANLNIKKLVLGGGSNILFKDDFTGLILKNEIAGIQKIQEDNESVLLKVGGGENWHKFVKYCVQNRFYGVENLALIPGTVGASPVQNIGAYGVEAKDIIEGVYFINLATGEESFLTNQGCNFDYRDSIFKNQLKDQTFITHVLFRLSKNFTPNLSYKGISEELANQNIINPTAENIFDVVVHIRKTKLPDPKVLGNCGSFFKNPVIDQNKFKNLKQQFADMPSFPDANGTKIPAAWLIEQCGFKGQKIGKVGCHVSQPLVIVNYGGASAQEALSLVKQIQHSVKEKFDIGLHPEVNIV